jgi:hypothetical protein
MITHPIALHKADLPALRDLMGKVNSRPLLLGEQSYHSRTLRFVTFAGSLADGLYRGEYRFQPHDGSPAETADLNQLVNHAL